MIRVRVGVGPRPRFRARVEPRVSKVRSSTASSASRHSEAHMSCPSITYSYRLYYIRLQAAPPVVPAATRRHT
eukprot:scaffold3239_cov67-Phaeocystis_antarctica.AAC.2